MVTFVLYYFMSKNGFNKQRILLLLLAGITLGFSGSPRRYARILKLAGREWRDINRREFNRAIRRLYESKLISCVKMPDGTMQVVLNKNGRKLAMQYKLDEMKIPTPSRWDGKWRIIMFDVPEQKKRMRDTLRMRLKQLGFHEFQKSVFVHPHECRDEIDFVIDLYNARQYVRFIEAINIDNELHLKKKFDLVKSY